MDKVKDNKIWVEKDGIIYVDINKADDEKDIMALLDELIELIEKTPGVIKVLLHIGTTSIIRSSKFRKEIGGKFKIIRIDRAAMCGGNTATRMIASFIIAASGLENIKIFRDKKEALEWLNRL